MKLSDIEEFEHMRSMEDMRDRRDLIYHNKKTNELVTRVDKLIRPSDLWWRRNEREILRILKAYL